MRFINALLLWITDRTDKNREIDFFFILSKASPKSNVYSANDERKKKAESQVAPSSRSHLKDLLRYSFDFFWNFIFNLWLPFWIILKYRICQFYFQPNKISAYFCPSYIWIQRGWIHHNRAILSIPFQYTFQCYSFQSTKDLNSWKNIQRLIFLWNLLNS